MASRIRVVVPLVFLLLASIVATGTEAAVSSCDSVWGDLYPCDLYVTQEGTLLDNCCEGLKTLNGAAKTPTDRQSICYCVKSYLSQVPPANRTIFAALPDACKVGLPYKLDLSPDCNRSP